MRRTPDAVTLRAAWWARRALREARAALAQGEVAGILIDGPPRLPASGIRGVEALLRRRRHTCLEGALVRQRWHADNGDSREIAIGVKGSSDGFVAHAWLVGDDDPNAAEFHELTRLSPS